MRIINTRIGSFGKLRDRNFTFDEGLNVVYGPNEAGKSTLRSFLTTTVFPKAPLKYPTPKGSDSGSVDVVLEDGSRYTFNREGKKSSGLGSQLCEIDDREYTSIYSMSPEDLRDVKGIEKGEIRNRFLTIPGGNDLPRVYSEIDQARTRLLPDQRRTSKCTIATLMTEENDCRQEVRRLQSRETGDNHCTELISQKKELERGIESAKVAVQEAENTYSAATKLSGRSKDLSTISELEQEESRLKYAENVDTAQYAVLKNDLDKKESALRVAQADAESLKRSVSGLDINTYLSVAPKIEHLRDMEGEYGKAVPKPAPAAPVVRQQKISGLSVIGILLMLIGVVAFAFVGVAGLAVSAVGLIVLILSLRNVKEPVPEPRPALVFDDPNKVLERELDDVALRVALPRRGFHADVRTLVGNLENIRACLKADDECTKMAASKDDACRSMNLFLSGFGGIEGYQRAVNDNKRLNEIRPKIQALKESTEVIDTENVPDEGAAREAFQSVNGDLTSLKSQLARVEQALKTLSGDTTVEEAITAEAEANDKIYAACYEWASLMLEKIILDRASETAYGAHRPEVLRRTDDLLSIMTDGRYALDTDPHRNELAVSEVSGGEVKTVSEWSSGLEDQVKLSVKLSVALSLSKEKPPIILDDVLLTSDSSRKENACKAIAKVAEEIQVIYFTCDKESFDFLRGSGANAICL